MSARGKSGAALYGPVCVKAGLPYRTPFMRAVVAGMLLRSGMLDDARGSYRKGHARDGVIAGVSRRLCISIIQAGWESPSPSVIYQAIGDALAADQGRDIERAIHAAVALSGMGHGQRVAPSRIAALAAGYLRNGIPMVQAKAPAPAARGPGMKPAEQKARDMWDALLPMVIEGRLGDFQGMLEGRERELGRNGIGDLLLWCASTVPGRVSETESCPFCMWLMGMGANVRRQTDDGREAHELASGRTAALLRVSRDYKRA